MTRACALPSGPVDLAAIATDARPASTATRRTARRRWPRWAPSSPTCRSGSSPRARPGSPRSVLLVLQGMDTSGKGGVLRHTVGLMDPQGVRITSFKAPTEEERAHDFLWRIQRAVPEPGYVGVFDRSHYEDVLIARVRELAPPEEIERRYGAINEFEARAGRRRAPRSSSACCTSPPRSRRSGCWPGSTTRPSTGSTTPATSTSGRCGRRTARPTRSRSSAPTPSVAPWHVVPADKKWYRNLAIGRPAARGAARHGPAVAGGRLRRRASSSAGWSRRSPVR